MNEILPCPFCGSTPDFPDAKDVVGTCYDAGCNDCGLPEISLQIIDCFDYPKDEVRNSWNQETLKYGTDYIEVARQQAIERWNRRAPTCITISDTANK